LQNILKANYSKYANIRQFYGPTNFDYNTQRNDLDTERTDVFVIARGVDDPSLNNPNGTAAVHMLTPGQWRTADNLLKGTMSPDPYMYAGPGSAFGGTYSTCWYAIKELVDLMAVARQEVPPLGLLEMVVPGTKMAGWIDMAEQRHCQNSTCCPVGGCDPITVAN
jgi:hypothetical protein